MQEVTLERYFEIIDRRAPAVVSRFIRWLREPSMVIIRWMIALLLVLGGVFSFLPVLGLWMLPLGLLLIAQDVAVLREPLLRSFIWFEQKWRQLKMIMRKRCKDTLSDAATTLVRTSTNPERRNVRAQQKGNRSARLSTLGASMPENREADFWQLAERNRDKSSPTRTPDTL